jgi:hypothetical protein
VPRFLEAVTVLKIASSWANVIVLVRMSSPESPNVASAVVV